MQELVAGVEKIRFDLEADVELQQGARPLPFPGMDSKLGAGSCGILGGAGPRQRVCAGPGVRCPFGHVGGKKTVVCKHWLRGLCKKGDGCEFLHEYDVAKVPECCFYSKFGKCSNKDCPFLHTDATASTVGCPWYDRGFCRHGELPGGAGAARPLCKYKHTRRVMCANYLVGFCPEGPKCQFTQYLVLLPQLLWGSSSQLPLLSPQGAGCPRRPAQLDPAAGEESGCKDVPPMEAPLPGTAATRHLTAQLWGTSSCPPGPQSLLEPAFCFKCGQKGHRSGSCGKTLLEILLGK
ncbi:CPSF4 factor, partial [Podilymbus podiceps]|nr:CPSF4 factor [Podilymbus podiceps]